MRPFQVGLLFFFGALALGAVFIFASFSGGSRTNAGEVSIWGSIPEDLMEDVLVELNRASEGFEGLEYTEVPEASFSAALTEAIAAGRGPDLILLSAERVTAEQEKLLPISYNALSRRDFQDTFIEAGEIFLAPEGILGVPFLVDPFVLYWNRTLFSSAGIARPPRYFDEFTDIASRITKHSEGGTLTQSAVALGEWANIRHAKEILLSLIIGLGNDVIVRGEDGSLQAVLAEQGESTVPPAESALRFYTDFSDPVKTVYSWNRSQADSYNAFLAGTLGVYLGRAGEAASLRAGNPNLNFDAAAYPTVRDGRVATPANLLALSIPRGAANPTGALQVALALSSEEPQRSLVSLSALPSVRRDILSENPQNPYESLFRDAALNAFSFPDPNPNATDDVFERMVESVSSGRLRVSEAVRSGQDELRSLIGVQ